MQRVIVLGEPIGKPVQSQRDKWSPAVNVQIYRSWADIVRYKAFGRNKKIMLEKPTELRVKAYFYPGKQHRVGPHTVKPDMDNVLKSVADALFINDQMVWRSSIEKLWCDGGPARVEIEWG